MAFARHINVFAGLLPTGKGQQLVVQQVHSRPGFSREIHRTAGAFCVRHKARQIDFVVDAQHGQRGGKFGKNGFVFTGQAFLGIDNDQGEIGFFHRRPGARDADFFDFVAGFS